MLLLKGLPPLCFILLLFGVLYLATTTLARGHEELGEDEDGQGGVEAVVGEVEGSSRADQDVTNDVKEESRADKPHKIKRIIRRRRKKRPQKEGANTQRTTTTGTPQAVKVTTTTTGRPSTTPREKRRKKSQTDTTPKPIETTTSTTRAPKNVGARKNTSIAPAPIINGTTIAPVLSTTSIKPSTTTTTSTSSKPLKPEEDGEETLVTTNSSSKEGEMEVVSVAKAPINRPNEIKANATVTPNMPVLPANSTTTSNSNNNNQATPSSPEQPLPTRAPINPATVTPEQIKGALDMPGVKCGQVPMYEKLYGRSINETVESKGQVRILHGLDSLAGEWPWIARITECKGSRCGTCTGTLLNHRWIITAGHCGYEKKDLSKFKVTFGLYDLVSPEAESFTVSIDKMIVHPDYGELQNDLTLIRLAQPLKFGPLIQPACLLGPTRNLLGLVANKTSYNVGYGMTEGMSEALKLQKLRVKAKPPHACNSDTLGSVQLKPNTVCMGVPDGKIGGSCKGDSGGPNLYYDPKRNQWVLFATVSYGPTVCDREDGEQWLTVSVDLSNYRTWILKTILLEG